MKLWAGPPVVAGVHDTAAHLARGVTESGGKVTGPEVAFALRNPDLYVNGVRVNMVSSAETLADQVEGLTADEVADAVMLLASKAAGYITGTVVVVDGGMTA